MKEYSLCNSKEEIWSTFPERRIKRIQLGGKQLAGVRIGESIFVFQAYCPHRATSLIGGSINGIGEVICPLHGYRFDLLTGEIRAGSCGDLEVFDARIESDGLKITVL